MLDRPDTSQQPDSSRLLLRLARDFGREHVGGYALSAVLLGLIAFSNISAAALLKPVLNGMVSADKFGDMRWMALEVLGLFVLRGAATYGSMLTLSRIGNRIVATAQRRAFDRLLNQSVIFFQDRHSSEFIARLALAANGVRDTLQLVVQSGARDLLTLFGLGAVMIYQDPLVAFGAVCALPILVFFIRKIIDRVRRFAKRSFQGSTQIMQTMSETVLGARIIKAFNLESEMRERMTRSVRTVESSANRIVVGDGLTAFLADLLAALAIGFAAQFGLGALKSDSLNKSEAREAGGRGAGGAVLAARRSAQRDRADRQQGDPGHLREAFGEEAERQVDGEGRRQIGREPRRGAADGAKAEPDARRRGDGAEDSQFVPDLEHPDAGRHCR